MYNFQDNKYKRGTIWEVDLGKIGSEKTSIQRGKRPCLIISNDIFNLHAPIIHVVAITSKAKPSPVHVEIPDECGLKCKSYALFEQIYTVDKTVLNYQIGTCTDEIMQKCDIASKIQNGIIDVGYIWSIVDRIKEIDTWLKDGYKLPNSIITQRELLLLDLRVYSEQLGKDFYKILNNRNIKLHLENTRGLRNEGGQWNKVKSAMASC